MTTQTYTPQEWLKAFGLISPIGLKSKFGFEVTGHDGCFWHGLRFEKNQQVEIKLTFDTDTLVNHLLNALIPLYPRRYKPTKVYAYKGEKVKLKGREFVLSLKLPALAKLINQDTYTKTGRGWGRG